MTRYILKIKLESEAAFGQAAVIAGLVGGVTHDYGFPFCTAGRSRPSGTECADIRTSLSSGRACGMKAPGAFSAGQQFIRR